MVGFSDINECDNNEHNCHVNANCTDTDGSFLCTCHSGYEGNGTNCTSEFVQNLIRNIVLLTLKTSTKCQTIEYSSTSLVIVTDLLQTLMNV